MVELSQTTFSRLQPVVLTRHARHVCRVTLLRHRHVVRRCSKTWRVRRSGALLLPIHGKQNIQANNLEFTRSCKRALSG